MAKDLTIRLLGRPQVSKDSQLGYQTVRRTYVVEGPRASLEGISDSNNPLFLAVGTPDEEFTDHYLVNQQLSPAEGSMDKARLVRDFVEIRNTWASESITESGDLRRLVRRYVVLRAEHPLGYDATSWQNHPRNPLNKENTPYDYLPEVVKDTVPAKLNQSLPAIPWTSGASVYFSGDTKLYPGLRGAGLNDGSWVEGGAQVSMSAPGVDVWSVAYVTHSNPYWTTATTGKSGGSTAPTAIVRFDENGIEIQRYGTSGSGGGTSQAYTLVFYAVGTQIPSSLVTAFGGSFNIQPSVHLDFTVTPAPGQGRSGVSYKQHIPNAVFRDDSAIEFPDLKGRREVVAVKGKYEYVFNGDLRISSGASTMKTNDYTGEEYMTEPVEKNLPRFQGVPITHAGGKISYTHTFAVASTAGSNVGTRIRPVFTRGDKRIWRVEITYVV